MLDSVSMVSEARCDFFENTEDFHVRLDKGMVESGDSLRGLPACVRFLRMSSRQRSTSGCQPASAYGGKSLWTTSC